MVFIPAVPMNLLRIVVIKISPGMSDQFKGSEQGYNHGNYLVENKAGCSKEIVAILATKCLPIGGGGGGRYRW